MRLLAASLLFLVSLSGTVPTVRQTNEPLTHDAYVWQRRWTPAVVEAVKGSADLVRDWRLLLAEVDARGRWTSVSIPWKDVRATGRPVIGVVRIDGQLDEKRMTSLLEGVVATADGVGLAGLEIDYDCPTSKLATYAKFLAALRERLSSSMALSITALPTWMGSSDLLRVAAPLSEIVLQVHAIDDPRRGLFDPDRAGRWVAEFGRRVGKPFRVALPTYDVRVSWRADGKLAAVEGEMPVAAAAGGQRLDASPQAVTELLHTLAREAPEGLRGIVWFRLPTDSDSRAWSRDTWRAVVTDRLTPPEITASLVATDRADVWTVVLFNEGPIDASLPRSVRLDASCEVGDGANGFRLGAADGPLKLEAPQSGRLRAHDRRIVGWARCTNPGRKLDVVR